MYCPHLGGRQPEGYFLELHIRPVGGTSRRAVVWYNSFLRQAAS